MNSTNERYGGKFKHCLQAHVKSWRGVFGFCGTLADNADGLAMLKF